MADEHCEVVQTNITHTTCHCTQMGHLAVMMEEGVSDLGDLGDLDDLGDLGDSETEEGALSLATLVIIPFPANSVSL